MASKLCSLYRRSEEGGRVQVVETINCYACRYYLCLCVRDSSMVFNKRFHCVIIKCWIETPFQKPSMDNKEMGYTGFQLQAESCGAQINGLFQIHKYLH